MSLSVTDPERRVFWFTGVRGFAVLAHVEGTFRRTGRAAGRLTLELTPGFTLGSWPP